MNDRPHLRDLLDDPAVALDSPDAGIRRLGVAAAASAPAHHDRLVLLLASDPEPAVRRECAEVLGRTPSRPREALERALRDEVAEVREAAATALGEIADPSSLDLLTARAADGDEDKLVREAAVAALGAIGDEKAVPVLLDLIKTGPPQIRRRCVPALSVFDGDDVDNALRGAALDRNPMVREVAEMVVGRAIRD